MRTCYLKVRQVLVNERCDKKDFKIAYIETRMMTADVLAEPSSGEYFHTMALLLLNVAAILFKVINQCFSLLTKFSK